MTTKTQVPPDSEQPEADSTARHAPVRMPHGGRATPVRVGRDERSAPVERSRPEPPVDPEPVSYSPSVAAHPRAAHKVRQAREWGGLTGFLLCGYLSLPTHTLLDATLRALMAGVLCYVTVWGATLFVWRQLVVAELETREQALLEARIARLADAEPAEGSPSTIDRPTARRDA